MKAMAGAAMATRVAAKNFMVDECEVCGVVDGGEGVKAVSGGQAIYILPCAVLRKGANREASPSQHMCAQDLAKLGPTAPAGQASRGAVVCVLT